MNLPKLILGICITILGILYFLYRLIYKADEIDKKNYSVIASQIKINGGVIVFIMIGLTLIYRSI